MYDNGIVPHEHQRNVRLFVDADGRLTDLLSRLKLKTSKISGIPDPGNAKRKAFAFVELSNRDVDTVTQLALGAHSKESPRSSKKRVAISPGLLAHAVATFGSERAAQAWLSSECGALNNRTPLGVIRADGTEAEVERILDCIDYGMLA